jgi:hypothetical protein
MKSIKPIIVSHHERRRADAGGARSAPALAAEHTPALRRRIVAVPGTWHADAAACLDIAASSANHLAVIDAGNARAFDA